MQNITRDKAFWKEQVREYMVRNKLTVAEVAERLGTPPIFIAGILYRDGEKIGYKTMGKLMPIWDENNGGENK